jgi:hypothetical protein
MKILKIPGKIILTLLYPLAHVTVLNSLDQLSGEKTGFFEGIKNIWQDKPKEE